MRHHPVEKATKEVVFQPMGRRMRFEQDDTILELARKAGVALVATCGGKGLCGKCRVSSSALSTPPSDQELELLGPISHSGERLACQTRLPEGGTVFVSEESRLRQQVILTAGQQIELQLDPILQVQDLIITLPSLITPLTMSELLLEALGGAESFSLPLSVLQTLPGALKDNSGQVTVVTRPGGEVIDVVPGWGRQYLGLAVDLGTTTVVAYLLDLTTGKVLAVEADVNPQISVGDDVISRIAYCQDKPDGLQQLASQIRECINRLAQQACEAAGLDMSRIMDCVMVGNTAMHHIFLGLDPVVLSQAPYTPIVKSSIELKARQVGLTFATEALLHWLPVKAGFVGADTVAVALAVAADQLTAPTLILDLGTNGEMILAGVGDMVCCSTAAGPAFEGGHISFGMRAAQGAIEKVVLDPLSLEAELTVIGEVKPLGLCGSGLLSLVSALVTAGAILPGGSFNSTMTSARLRSGSEGMEYVIAFAEQSGLGHDLVLTSRDVAEIQLAKGAIRAGVEIMMLELGVKNLGEVLLAGAFGNYLDPKDAENLGLFPCPDQERIRGVGNAAGAGAIMALISHWVRDHAKIMTHNIRYIELTTHPQFHDFFIDGMACTRWQPSRA